MLNECYRQIAQLIQFALFIFDFDRTEAMVLMVVAVVLGTYLCRGLASKLQ